jgi:cation:H+ antiporter
MFDWLVFGVSAGVVVGAGITIGRISGEIGERLGLGRAWSGAVLLSVATTLPEAVTTLTVAARGAYGMAVGGILGSILFNLFILVVVDVVDPEPLYHRLSKNHLATGLLGAALLGIVLAGLSLSQARTARLAVFDAGILWGVPVAIIGLYGVGQYVLFKIGRQSGRDEEVRSPAFNRLSLRQLAGVYVATAAVIIAAAHRLGVSAERIADRYDLGATFAGATLLGIVTSLPEITNAIACSRRREYDLAVGNILGANTLVLAVLAAVDLLFRNRIFQSVPVADALSGSVMAGLAVVMLAVALGALAIESRQQISRLSLASFVLAGLYAASLYASYHFSAAAP